MDIKALIARVLKPSRTDMPLFVALAAFSLVAIANGFQHIGGIAPCPLCLDQRQAYWMAILASGLTYFLSRHPSSKDGPGAQVASVLITLALAYGFYLAAFHTGVEQGWWDGPASCTSGGAGASFEDLISGDVAVVMCDEIPWSLFGISIAGYNALAALALTLYSVLPHVQRWIKK